MRTDERRIEKQFGKNPGFRVPDDYFEHLVGDVMNRLPECESNVIPLHSSNNRGAKWRKLVLAAACLCGVVFGVDVLLQPLRASSDQIAHVDVNEDISVNKTIDQVAHYSMIDNEDMYAYVADN